MKTLRSLLTAAALIATAFTTSGAHAFVAGSPAAGSAAEVRIRLHAQLHAEMKHPDGTVWTREELEQSVQWVLSRMNAGSRGDLPFLWLDTTTTPSNCTYDYGSTCPSPSLIPTCGLGDRATIHIVPVNCGTAFWYSSGTDHMIQLQMSDSVLGNMWYHHASGAGGVMLEQVLMHEIGHALGLGHPQDGSNWASLCPSGAPACSVMQGGADAHYYDTWTLDDRDGLRAIYGYQEPYSIRLFERANPGSTFSMGEMPTDDLPYARDQMSATTTTGVTGNEIFLSSYWRSSDLPYVHAWDWASLDTTTLGIVHFNVSSGPMGVALTNQRRFVVTNGPQLTSDSSRYERRMMWSTQDRSGGTFTTRTVNGSGLSDTRVQGVGSAFDPRSGEVISAFRRDDGTIVMRGASDATTPTVFAPFDTGRRSFSTPSLACVPATYSANCILLYTDVGRPESSFATRRLRWVEFNWSNVTHRPTFFSERVESDLLYYDPAVTSVESSPGVYRYVYIQHVPYSTSVRGGYYLRAHTKTPGSSYFSLAGTVFSTGGVFPEVAVGAVRNYLDVFVGTE